MANSSMSSSYEISLLDFILSILKNLRMLILGPIFIGLIAYGASYLLPQSYEASAALKGTQQMASMFLTPVVIDSAIAEIKLQEADQSIDEIRGVIRKNIQAEFNPKDGLLSVSVKAKKTDEAKLLLDRLLKSLFLQSIPKGEDLKRIRMRIESTEKRIEDASISAQQIQKRILQDNSKSINDAAVGYANIISEINNLEKVLVELKKEIAGIDESSLVQPSMVDRIKNDSRHLKTGVISGLISLGILIFIIFIKPIFDQVYKDQESQDKIIEIKKILKIKIYD
jgi:hypothetical protein